MNIELTQIPEQAKKIADSLKGGEIFALIGDLGSGKTTFVKAIAKNLKLRHRITSPTFTLLHCFPVKLKQPKKTVLLYHLDLYRTKNFKEAKSLGLTEFWGQKNTITFIEWADKISRHLPKKTKVIKFLSR
ncbi:MAG: tRNA (adenosine(37)-N6)-threonylcarbamoyltransferase complex ATPase subunit type 1 TsaE [Candidatus Doudnabacteria bacterium]|nr:tRNA (adenosine(37)-N6)-threonylcarbamoyltransferase complex ATPase subunit type 1 TsaE [Candidatus Doudnabacteria bacterium]